MKSPAIALLIGAVALGGCSGGGQSRYNPLSWFSRDKPNEVTPDTPSDMPEDGRQLVRSVTALEVDRHPGGAIVTATGLPPTQGFWMADLFAENGGEPVDGVLRLRFVVAPPAVPQVVSTTQSREVTAASYLSDVKLAAIREIVVIGAENSRVSRR